VEVILVRRRSWPTIVATVLLFARIVQAQNVPLNVTAEKFLRMSPAEQSLYTDGVLDALVGLAADNKIPQEAASCARMVNYGELISGVNSYLYKGLGSQSADVKGAMKHTPVSLWIMRLYWQKCSGK
jgi:hypothetical protein